MKVTEATAAEMSSETREDFIKDNVLLHTVKSPGYKQVPPALGSCGLPALKTEEEIPGAAASFFHCIIQPCHFKPLMENERP